MSGTDFCYNIDNGRGKRKFRHGETFLPVPFSVHRIYYILLSTHYLLFSVFSQELTPCRLLRIHIVQRSLSFLDLLRKGIFMILKLYNRYAGRNKRDENSKVFF